MRGGGGLFPSIFSHVPPLDLLLPCAGVLSGSMPSNAKTWVQNGVEMATKLSHVQGMGPKSADMSEGGVAKPKSAEKDENGVESPQKIALVPFVADPVHQYDGDGNASCARCDSFVLPGVIRVALYWGNDCFVRTVMAAACILRSSSSDRSLWRLCRERSAQDDFQLAVQQTLADHAKEVEDQGDSHGQARDTAAGEVNGDLENGAKKEEATGSGGTHESASLAEHPLQSAITSFDMALGELNQLVHLVDLARAGEFMALERVTPSDEDQARAMSEQSVRGYARTSLLHPTSAPQRLVCYYIGRYYFVPIFLKSSYSKRGVDLCCRLRTAVHST